MNIGARRFYETQVLLLYGLIDLIFEALRLCKNFLRDLIHSDFRWHNRKASCIEGDDFG